MHNFAKKFLAGAILAGASTPAMAADLYVPPVVEVPVVVGGWYIRGHLGMSNQDFDGLSSDLYDDPTIIDSGFHDEGGFASAPIFGVGIGYEFTDYLRGDLMVEYRGNSDFDALDWVDSSVTGLTTNEYTAKKNEWLVMANAYADLGTYYNVTPYIGAGIGASYNTISHFRDVNIITGGGAYAEEESEWNFAWALHAGLGIAATDRLTVDLGYSFVSLGDATTGALRNDDPDAPFPPADNDGMQFNDIYSHDFKLGVRYALN
jgi:opacity protein-like surface antigen